jgi:Protease subunit of ATP-dependent Clp proteases
MTKRSYIDIVSKETREATMRLYGVIGEKVDGDLFAQEMASLDDMGLDLIRIRGNTPGGSVYQGMSIVSAVLSMNTPVYFHVDGVVASMGAFVAVACDRVIMMDYSKLMVHDPYFAGAGTDKLSRKDRKALGRLTDMLRQVLGRRGKSEDEVAKIMKEETWYSAEEAVSAGLCDEITPSARGEFKAMAPLQLVAAIEAEYKPNNNETMDKINLTAAAVVALGVKEEAFDAKGVSQAILDMKAKHDEQVKILQEKIDAMEGERKEERKAEAVVMVDEAVKAGKITAELKDDYLAMFEADFDRTKKILQGAAPRKSLAGQIVAPGGGTSKFDGKSWDELDRSGLLGELKAKEPERYAQMYADAMAGLRIEQ